MTPSELLPLRTAEYRIRLRRKYRSDHFIILRFPVLLFDIQCFKPSVVCLLTSPPDTCLYALCPLPYASFRLAAGNAMLIAPNLLRLTLFYLSGYHGQTFAQEHIHSSGATVAGSRRGKCENQALQATSFEPA